MTKTISGIFAPVTTPFVNEEVSLEHLKQNFRKYSETPLNGFLVLGSTKLWHSVCGHKSIVMQQEDSENVSSTDNNNNSSVKDFPWLRTGITSNQPFQTFEKIIPTCPLCNGGLFCLRLPSHLAQNTPRRINMNETSKT